MLLISFLDVAREHRVTVSTILQAAWAWLLSVNSGESDVLFGVTVSGRALHAIPSSATGKRESLEGMVGMTINTLPTRCNISPTVSVHDWLVGLQKQQVSPKLYNSLHLSKIRILS